MLLPGSIYFDVEIHKIVYKMFVIIFKSHSRSYSFVLFLKNYQGRVLENRKKTGKCLVYSISAKSMCFNDSKNGMNSYATNSIAY